MPPRLLILEPHPPGPAMSRYAAGLLAALSKDFDIARSTARHAELRGPLKWLVRRPDASGLQGADRSVDVVHATDIYLSPHLARFSGARIVTVHDLMPHNLFRRWPYRAAIFHEVFERSRRHLRKADLVLTPSEFTRRELLAAGPVPPERVVVVPPCLPDEMRPDPAVARLDNTIVSLGPNFAYKNVPLLLHALAQPALRGATVIRVGKLRPGHRELAERLGVLARISETGRLSDAELVRLYQSGAVLAHPSFCEGFGLPVAEAMLCGLPVVVSDGGALPEVAGAAGRIVPLRSRIPRSPVNFDDVRDFAAALSEVLADSALRGRMSEAGLRESARFRTAPVRTQLLAAYDTAQRSAANR
jgi:glycosyltransferase involved in cell wall biosynthesis